MLSGIYFIIITNWLNVHGDGQLMAASRFGNLTIDPEAGFAGIVKNVISNPAYFFSLFIKEDTLVFFLQMTLPLMFLPFMTRKIHRFLLIIPFVIMNLVVGAGYGYAANIRFQYVFGTECLLIYMALINCEDLERKNKNTLVIASAAASVLTSVCLFSNLFIYYENYYSYESHYTALDECLDTVPSDASVIAYRNYLPHIADRSEIYIFDSNDFTADPYDETNLILNLSESYDFYVMSLAEDITEYAVPQLEAAGYTKFNEVPDYLVIYVSPDYVFAG